MLDPKGCKKTETKWAVCAECDRRYPADKLQKHKELTHGITESELNVDGVERPQVRQ